jgi:hypothetical protein
MRAFVAVDLEFIHVYDDNPSLVQVAHDMSQTINTVPKLRARVLFSFIEMRTHHHRYALHAITTLHITCMKGR